MIPSVMLVPVSSNSGAISAKQGWNGNYFPVDAVVDGTDLEKFEPRPRHLVRVH
jgi:hypothetical protein